MTENRVEVMVPVDAPRPSGRWPGVRRWILILLAVAIGLLLVEIVILGALEGWIDTPEVSQPEWLEGSALGAVLATSTPTPTPTPTPSPAEVADTFVPQLRWALTNANWDRALELVAIMQAIDTTGEPVRQWAFTTHMQYGQALVGGRQAAEAQMQFDEAAALYPSDSEARLWQTTTQLYLAGRDAFAADQWDAAILAFSQAYAQMPDYGDAFGHLVASYKRKGRAAIEAEDWPVAIAALIEAQERMPDDADIASLLSMAYRGLGQVAMSNEDWTAAIETMTEAQGRLPDDQQVTGLLAAAYRQRGIARHENLKLKAARADLEAALDLRPGDSEAKTHLDRVVYLLSKRIEIDISQQRLYAYKGERLVYKFPVSTGLRGRDTSTGNFHILDKIPMAYSRIWRLKMPYWMGVYWVKGIENGIHALPIRPDGSIMWAGLLGQRASYGCIILSNAAAKKLYNWADIGTPVHIRR